MPGRRPRGCHRSHTHPPAQAPGLRAGLLQVTDQYNEHWRTDWIASDFWYLLNFIFLCVVCWLFRPSQQAARYALDLEGGLTGP